MPRAPHVTSQSGSGSTLGQYIPTSGMFKGSDGRYNLQLPEVTEKQKLTRRYSTGSRYDGDNNQASSPVLSRTQYPQPLPQPSHVMPHVYAPLTHTQPASLPEYVELNQKAADKSVIHDLREHASIEKVQPSDCMEIIQHPQNCHVIVSHPLKLECAVCIRGSTEAPNYLWYKNGSALVGEVNKTYIVSTVTQADAGEYFCLVSDPFDRVRQQSNAAVVTVAELPIVPEIVEHPLSSVEVAFGEAVEVCVKAIGKQPLQYTWYKNTKELFYASTAIVCIPNATRMDNGSYCCSVANEYGSVLSGSCQVKVVHKGPAKVLTEQLQKTSLSSREQLISVARSDVPRIVSQPEDMKVVYGQQFGLRVKVDNVDAFTRYSWYKNEFPLLGRDSPHMIIHSAVSEDAGRYYCVISNSVGFTRSVSAQVEVVRIQDRVKAVFKPQSHGVSEQPVISRHPSSQEVEPGLPLLLSCEASVRTGRVEYLWYFNGLSLSGETRPQYFIHCFTDEDEGLYSCRVSSNGGSVMSDIAQVTIKPDSN